MFTYTFGYNLFNKLFYLYIPKINIYCVLEGKLTYYFIAKKSVRLNAEVKFVFMNSRNFHMNYLLRLKNTI